MWKFWQYHGPVFQVANEGAAGVQGTEQASPGAGAGSSGEAEAGTGGTASEKTGGQTPIEGGRKSSILDFATGENKGEPEGGEAWKLPDGLDIPAHLVGVSAEDTLAKMNKAYSGLRTTLAKGGKIEGLEGSVPESADGYKFEPTGDDDKIAAELNSEASKPIVDAFKAAAHKLGIPDAAFSQLMRDGLAGAAEAGIPLGVSNEEAAAISGEAEMATLSKEVGAAEAGVIINTIKTYGEKLVQRGVLSDEADVEEFSQMMGTARASRIFHRILTGELGERPIPPADGADGSITKEEAYAAHASAMKMPAGAERDNALIQAQAKMVKAFGNSTPVGGSVKSNVL